MITLGIDLASQPRNTAICALRWSSRGAEVDLLRADVDDEALLERARASEWIGIDAPFGWPRAFTQFVAENRERPRLQAGQQELRLRATDLWCWKHVTGRPPLSVSTDRIALPAFRCAGLLERLGIHDRTSGPAFEVYPAAALHRWVGLSRGYKGKNGASVRELLVARLRAEAPWLEVPEACVTSDDLLDALVSALVARARAVGVTEEIPPELAQVVRTEGWIEVPQEGSLGRLRAGT